MDKEYVVHIYNGISLNHLKEWSNAICSNMDRPRDWHTEWSKLDREEVISYDTHYMWNIKRNDTNELRRQEQTHKHREWTHGCWGEETVKKCGTNTCASCAPSLSCVQFFVPLWTVACQAPLFIGFPRQEYWSGLPFSPPGDLPNTGVEPILFACPANILISHLPVKLSFFPLQPWSLPS